MVRYDSSFFAYAQNSESLTTNGKTSHKFLPSMMSSAVARTEPPRMVPARRSFMRRLGVAAQQHTEPHERGK